MQFIFLSNFQIQKHKKALDIRGAQEVRSLWQRNQCQLVETLKHTNSSSDTLSPSSFATLSISVMASPTAASSSTRISISPTLKPQSATSMSTLVLPRSYLVRVVTRWAKGVNLPALYWRGKKTQMSSKSNRFFTLVQCRRECTYLIALCWYKKWLHFSKERKLREKNSFLFYLFQHFWSDDTQPLLDHILAICLVVDGVRASGLARGDDFVAADGVLELDFAVAVAQPVVLLSQV